MVYKRYIKRNGKLVGPYYYESYRDENGKVISRYLKDYKPPKNYSIYYNILIIFLFIFILSLLYYFRFFNFIGLNDITGYDIYGAFGGSATNGNIVYQCGEINESGTYYMNQSIIQTNDDNCINITIKDVVLDCNGSYINNNYNRSGIYLFKQNVTIKNCNISMNNNGTGIYLELNNLTLLSNVSINNAIYGIFFHSSKNNIVQDTTIQNSVVYDVFLNSTSINNSFVNCSYNISKENVTIDSELYRKWYYRAISLDEYLNGLNNSNITIFNSFGDLEFSLLTNDSGYTDMVNLVDYKHNDSIIYYSDFSIFYYYNQSLISNKSYNVSYFLNNLNDSFIYDINPPLLRILTPLPSLTYTVSEISFGIYSPENLDSCKLSINFWQTNYTMTRYNSSYFIYTIGSLPNGGYDARFSCNDSSGNINNSMSVYFIVAIPVQGPPGNTGTGTSNNRNTNTTNNTFTNNSRSEMLLNQSYLNETIRIVNYTNCSDWTECKSSFEFSDIISLEKNYLFMQKTRVCRDERGNNIFLRKNCTVDVPITLKKSKDCFEEFLEIYNINNSIVSRMKLFESGKDFGLNIQILINKKGYCPYCYDGVKDYDETDIDCGGSCANCVEKARSVPISIRVVDYSLFIIIAMIVIVFNLAVLLTLKYKFLKDELINLKSRERFES